MQYACVIFVAASAVFAGTLIVVFKGCPWCVFLPFYLPKHLILPSLPVRSILRRGCVLISAHPLYAFSSPPPALRARRFTVSVLWGFLAITVSSSRPGARYIALASGAPHSARSSSHLRSVSCVSLLNRPRLTILLRCTPFAPTAFAFIGIFLTGWWTMWTSTEHTRWGAVSRRFHQLRMTWDGLPTDGKEGVRAALLLCHCLPPASQMKPYVFPCLCADGMKPSVSPPPGAHCEGASCRGERQPVWGGRARGFA